MFTTHTTKYKFMTKPSAFVFAFACLLILLILAVSLPSQASALSGADFDPGHIIDDQVFYNKDAMSVAQIQNFLNAKQPNCDTNGSKMYTYHYRASPLRINDSRDPLVTTTRAVFGWRISQRDGTWRGSRTPYICLKDYRETTTYIAPESDLCSGYTGANNESAATIIYKVAQSCGINPQVLLVTLQKEQSLITDDWPWGQQYTKAMGYNCPDSKPAGDENGNGCVDWSEGFFKQVYYGAHRFKVYKANPDNYNYKAGRNNTILWHPNTSCGTSQVFIQNQATAALYIYTPYRPNQAALDNLYGTGNGCSSYGVRNFWRLFNDWFGSTLIPWQPLKIPRWMETSRDLYKKNPFTGENIDSLIPAGTKIYFSSKITINGNTYLRTRHDHNRVDSKGILITDLEEAEFTYEPMLQPRWMEIGSATSKIDQRTERKVGSTLDKGAVIYFHEKMSLGGITYLRTAHDSKYGVESGIPLSSLGEATVEYQPFVEPRWMQVTKDTYEYDLTGFENVEPLIVSGSHIYLDTKFSINNKYYYRHGLPTEDDYFGGIPAEDITDIEPLYEPLVLPRAFKLKTDLRKENPITNKEVDDIISADSLMYFTSKIKIGDETYLRTMHDTDRGYLKGVPISALEEVPVTFQPMLVPRVMTVRYDLHKKDPVTGQNIDQLIRAGSKISFSTKISINGETFLRTSHDTDKDYYKVIPLSALN